LSDADEGGTHWLLWPFVAVWKLLTLILEVTGRIISAVLGLVFMAVGVTISLSVVGAPLGIPIAALGMLLLVRSLF
jgi:hypothetical protein